MCPSTCPWVPRQTTEVDVLPVHWSEGSAEFAALNEANEGANQPARASETEHAFSARRRQRRLSWSSRTCSSFTVRGLVSSVTKG